MHSGHDFKFSTEGNLRGRGGRRGNSQICEDNDAPQSLLRVFARVISSCSRLFGLSHSAEHITACTMHVPFAEGGSVNRGRRSVALLECLDNVLVNIRMANLASFQSQPKAYCHATAQGFDHHLRGTNYVGRHCCQPVAHRGPTSRPHPR